MKTIIFDIDGTLANNAHRQHFVRGDGPADWERFFSMAREDTVNLPVVELYRTLDSTGSYQMVLVSGRPERYREETEKWLTNNDIRFAQLYMRKDSDRRPDHEIKREILFKLQGESREILLVVDDRSQTVGMWREQGLTCLQCANHEY